MDANELLRSVYRIAHRLEEVRIPSQDYPLNNTEMQMMREIVTAREEGMRLISSRLAKTLGVTRSAISQMVNKLERKNLVRRIPDAVDRKIAYIELSPSAMKMYEEMKDRVNCILGAVIEKMGEERIETFLSCADEFVELFGDEVEKYGTEMRFVGRQ